MLEPFLDIADRWFIPVLVLGLSQYSWSEYMLNQKYGSTMPPIGFCCMKGNFRRNRIGGATNCITFAGHSLAFTCSNSLKTSDDGNGHACQLMVGRAIELSPWTGFVCIYEKKSSAEKLLCDVCSSPYFSAFSPRVRDLLNILINS